ncbi:MAG: hypothetical protein OK436_03120 [Thaumarchaeota archaeon]|nr:hypothetical protein [Nitrososphaerota archaeon]
MIQPKPPIIPIPQTKLPAYASPPAVIPTVTLQIGNETVTSRGVLTSNSPSAQIMGFTAAVNAPIGTYGDDYTTQATRKLYIATLAQLKATPQ